MIYFSGADLVYNVLTAVNKDLLKTSIKVKSFIDENIKEKIRILSSVLEIDENKHADLTSFSLKSKDPEWFQGMINLNILYHLSTVLYINKPFKLLLVNQIKYYFN